MQQIDTVKITPQLRDDPVIVLGMHHSGTSILAEILHRFGVFMQANMHHHEAKFFVDINDRMIMGGGGNWARSPIMPVAEVLARLPEVHARIQRRAYEKYLEAGYEGQSHWGFKDPRTCVTLPLFLEIFPHARLLHIIRNEKDVAASLASNEKRGLGRETDLNFWMGLQRQYVARVQEYGARHRRFYEFQYEDFCRQPVATMQNVFAYLELPFAAGAADFLQKTVYTHRINIAQRDDPG